MIIPDGWKLVPLEPTMKMGGIGLKMYQYMQSVPSIDFFEEVQQNDQFQIGDIYAGNPSKWCMPIYRAMISVSPEPPTDDGSYVTLPVSIEHAKAMLLVAQAYLKQHEDIK